MHRYFLGALIAFFIMFWAIMAFGQQLEGPQAQLYSKPVLCAPNVDNAIEVLGQIKKDGMKPLMYFYGSSFNGDGSKFYTDYFILYDPSDQQITIVERQGPGGFTCIVTGGTGQVEFNPEAIQGIIGWNDIP